MHIGEILKADTSNGSGMRLTIFVSGCTIHCPDCFNQKTWDFDYGVEWTEALKESVIEEVSKSYYKGITILGGEPFEPENQIEISKFLKEFKERLPEKDIWMFTGNQYDVNLQPGGNRYTDDTDDILNMIDILVDGPFKKDLKNITLNFRGSENQRIIDMKKTREKGEIVLHPLNDFVSRY